MKPASALSPRAAGDLPNSSSSPSDLRHEA